MSGDPTAEWTPVHWAVYEKVRAFVADAADVTLDAVHPQTNIFTELGVDSLGLALILVNLEDEYSVTEPENIREIGPQLDTPIAIVDFALAAVQPH